MADLEFVEEFNDPFRKKDDDCDLHGLKDSTVLQLRDERIGNSKECVFVRGEHPWEYRHFSEVSKAKLDRERDRAKRRYMNRRDYDEETAEEVVEEKYSIEEVAKNIAHTVFGDSKATPHGMSQEDYDLTIQVKETDNSYEIMSAWEPV